MSFATPLPIGESSQQTTAVSHFVIKTVVPTSGKRWSLIPKSSSAVSYSMCFRLVFTRFATTASGIQADAANSSSSNSLFLSKGHDSDFAFIERPQPKSHARFPGVRTAAVNTSHPLADCAVNDTASTSIPGHRLRPSRMPHDPITLVASCCKSCCCVISATTSPLSYRIDVMETIVGGRISHIVTSNRLGEPLGTQTPGKPSRLNHQVQTRDRESGLVQRSFCGGFAAAKLLFR
jgi:hypothetical protein